MTINRNNLYKILFIACVAGYIWLYFGLSNKEPKYKSVEVCLIKHVTNIPCPSCGSTRSVVSLSKGNFIEALQINPFGYIVAIIMILIPVWLTIDISLKKSSLFDFYLKIETYLKRPQYAIPLVLLVIINWIWNITKNI